MPAVPRQPRNSTTARRALWPLNANAPWTGKEERWPPGSRCCTSNGRRFSDGRTSAGTDVKLRSGCQPRGASQRMSRTKLTMRVVSVAAGDPVLIAPPALAFDRHAVDYGCGHCGVDLLRTETPSRPGQLGRLRDQVRRLWQPQFTRLSGGGQPAGKSRYRVRACMIGCSLIECFCLHPAAASGVTPRRRRFTAH